MTRRPHIDSGPTLPAATLDAIGAYRLATNRQSTPMATNFSAFRLLMRGDARQAPIQAHGMTTSIPDVGDEVGLRRMVRQAIERVRAMDLPEADKRAWIAYIESNYRAARAGEPPKLDL